MYDFTYIPTAAMSFFMQLLIANGLFFYNFKRKKKFALRISLSLVLSFIIFILFAPFFGKLLFGFFIGGRTILCFTLFLITALICFDRKPLDAIFCAVAALLVQNMGSCLFDICLTLFVEGAKYKPLSIYMFLSYGLVYFFIWLAVCRNLKGLEDISANRIMTLIVGIISYFLVCFFFIKSSNYFASDRGTMFIYCRLLIFGCDFLAIFSMFNDLKRRYLMSENMMIEKLMKDTHQHYKIESQAIDMINIKCHDLKHRLEYLKPVDKEDSLALEELKKSIMIYESMAKTGNEVTDIVISNKVLVCEKNSISFTYQVDGKAVDFMSKTELATLLGNILDNAIEYLSKVETIENRFINMNIFSHMGIIGMHIENYCEDKIEFKEGLPVTTKKDKNYHGFGVKSIKYIVNKYNGNMTIGQNDNLFSIDITIPKPTNN